MNFFISYRFSDLSKEDLDKLITPIYNLIKFRYPVFCNFYKDEYYKQHNYTAKQIMKDCFNHIDNSDIIICLVDTNKYSCGMLLEIGYALAKNKKIIVCSRSGCEIDTLVQMSNTHISYNNYDELKKLITIQLDELYKKK